MSETQRTSEEHHNKLVDELLYELQTYGPRSVAAVVATLLESDDTPAAWAHFARLFRAIEGSR
jgi:hypothetical protein